MRLDLESDFEKPRKKKLAVAIAGAIALSGAAYAQEPEREDEEVIVTGIIASLSRAMDVKRDAATVVDSIASEDLGKFPDLNVAESLQRITGVSIDRDGGEGKQVTVRGFGPQFNMVLVNGRQVANDSSGREFNFDILAADQITGADVYKSAQASLQDGGIGATINVSTARPFDNAGFQFVASAKGVYESLSEETSPAVSALISNTFADDTFGALLAVSHQERTVQINRIETVGWRPGLTLENNTDGVIASNVFLPRNWDQIVDEQDRTRTNGSLVLQYAPNDDISVTVDGFVSTFEVDSLVTDLASWFEPDRVGSAEIDANGTAVFFTQEQGLDISSGAPRTDFVSHTRNSRDSTTTGFGVNIDYAINDNLQAVFDASMSDAENDQAGKNRFNVIGIDNNYQFDSRSGSPIVSHDGFGNGNLLPIDLNRAHYNERSGFTDEDEITELKLDFEYSSDSDVFQKLKFGAYTQSREKSRIQKFTNAGCAFCGYITPVPDGLVRPFTASNFFSGLIDTFYTYDGEAYFDYLETPSTATLQDQIIVANDPTATPDTAAALGAGFIPELQNNRYNIEEDITSLYIDITFGHDIGDMPLLVNFGARYSQTDISVMAVQSSIDDVVPTSDLTLFSNVLGDPTEFSQGGSYANLLPSVNVRLDITDDMVFRYAFYDSLTRPTLDQLSPATIFEQPRRQNLAADGGNPTLKPFKSENWDASFEWYYGDASSFTFAFFNKEVEDFIITLTGEETFTLQDRIGQPDERCNVANEPTCADDTIALANPELNGLQEIYSVTRPQNGESAVVSGYEIAWTHVFEFGLGISANATVVDSDASLDANTSQSFALEGLGDSQNLVVFYERGPWQGRIAFNNREAFLRNLDNGFNGEPINTRTFGQWDISGSYDITDNLTVFFEGINITEEELEQTGRFDNQIFTIEDNGSRYALGVRAKF